MAYMAKDKIVRTGTDINLATVVDLQTDATALGGIVDAVGGVTMTAAANRMEKIVKVTLGSATGGGGILAWKNPEATAILVTRLVVRINDAAAESETIDFGGAANGTTSSGNLIDNLAADTAIIACNIKNAGTTGRSGAYLAVDEYVTGTVSGAITSFAGTAYIHYILA